MLAEAATKTDYTGVVVVAIVVVLLGIATLVWLVGARSELASREAAAKQPTVGRCHPTAHPDRDTGPGLIAML